MGDVVVIWCGLRSERMDRFAWIAAPTIHSSHSRTIRFRFLSVATLFDAHVHPHSPHMHLARVFAFPRFATSPQKHLPLHGGRVGGRLFRGTQAVPWPAIALADGHWPLCRRDVRVSKQHATALGAGAESSRSATVRTPWRRAASRVTAHTKEIEEGVTVRFQCEMRGVAVCCVSLALWVVCVPRC